MKPLSLSERLNQFATDQDDLSRRGEKNLASEAAQAIDLLTAERDQLAAQCNQLRCQLEYFIGNTFEFNEGSEYIAEDIEELLSKTPEICLSDIRANAIREFAKETADGFSVPFVKDFAEDFIRNEAAKTGD